jgi:hypothetical protein
MVIGEADEIEAGTAEGSEPPAGLGVGGVPVMAVAPVVGGEIADVVDEGAGIAHAKATGAVDLGQSIARAALVGGDTVGQAEDLLQVVVGMIPGSAEVLGRLEPHGVVGVLHAIVLANAAVPLRPIDGLVVVPETADMDIGGGGARGHRFRLGPGQERKGSEKKEKRQAFHGKMAAEWPFG